MTAEGDRARFPRQPLPTAQSVLWRPAAQELARADADTSLIFIAQRALATIQDHLHSAPTQALLGFLVGRVLESPDSDLPYVVVHGAVRVPQLIVPGATERVVAQTLAAAQRMVPPEEGVVVGWYRTDPTGAVKLSAEDHAAHVHHFQRPWQLLLLMSSARGGVFRPTGEPGSPAPFLPFYELLDPEHCRDGWKEPHVSWTNYWSPDPAVWRRAAAEPAQLPAPFPPPQAPAPAEPATIRAPRITPSGRPSGGRRYAPVLLPPDDEDTEPAWRGRPPGRGAWRWGLLAGAAVGGAIWLGIWLGLGPSLPPTPDAPAADSAPQSPQTQAADSVRQALDAYHLKAGLFANQQMTCADLGAALTDVDEQWLRYTMASPLAAAPGDTALTPAQRDLAAAVDGVEADFERSGCPRP